MFFGGYWVGCGLQDLNVFCGADCICEPKGVRTSSQPLTKQKQEKVNEK